jgi:uroporphyrinogen decarboxylase
MTGKERFLAAVNHVEPDRVPTGYVSMEGPDKALKKYFGLAADDHAGLRTALGVDIAYMIPWYKGPALHEPIEGRTITEWGVRMKWVETAEGDYWDYCDFPLKDAGPEELAAWPMPDPDHFDLNHYEAFCDANAGRAIGLGNPGLCDVINSNGMVRGAEQVLVDLALEDEDFLAFVDRKLDVQLAVMERALQRCGDKIDFLFTGDDLGTQKAPLISLDMFRRLLRPRHQRFVDLAKAYNKKIMMHSCGCARWVYEELVEMGVDVVDALQPEATDMEPASLKEQFKGRLAFHGCISVAEPLSSGTPDDVRAYCRRMLDTLMPGGGYCFAPANSIMHNTPVENILAMYETAHQYGVYS